MLKFGSFFSASRKLGSLGQNKSGYLLRADKHPEVVGINGDKNNMPTTVPRYFYYEYMSHFSNKIKIIMKLWI